MLTLSADQLQTIFGANLRARRIQLGMTQQKLATAAGLSQPFVALMERGERAPTFETLTKLADTLCTTPNLLLAEKNFAATA